LIEVVARLQTNESFRCLAADGWEWRLLVKSNPIQFKKRTLDCAPMLGSNNRHPRIAVAAKESRKVLMDGWIDWWLDNDKSQTLE
jgi:hypothetical protein